MVAERNILVTGATGSFGRAFVQKLLTLRPRVIRCLSRDEVKQSDMEAEFNDERLRFFLGDVRDRDVLFAAMKDVDYVIHAAAYKQIVKGEYNPKELVKTNILGTLNVCEMALRRGVSKVVFVSTDKACQPCNLYGKTKAVAESLVVQANTEGGNFACVRYGNVAGSRGSVIPFFLEHKDKGWLPITHPDMTRFNITLEQGVDLVLFGLRNMKGGEIFVPKLPSMRIMDLAKVIGPECELRITGIRAGEKIHELLVTEDEARHTREFDHHYVILPEFPFWTEKLFVVGKPLPEGFSYSSGKNTLLSPNELAKVVKDVS